MTLAPTFQYTSNDENLTTGTTQTSDATITYPPSTTTQTATYNALNQLTMLSNPPPASQLLTYDANGNLLSDGGRTYSWDAENRLVAIAYPGQSGKATSFTYDGLGRRTSISSTPAGGGGTVTTSYIWCGLRPCEARGAGNAVMRGYYAEGEFQPGSPAQSDYYALDQLGSVRRVFTSVSATTYDYDPYGAPLQSTAVITDYGYAGMFTHADSGLYLTMFRAYDPVSGRWLSRDPIGETSDSEGNLYAYVNDDPISYIDPDGRASRGPRIVCVVCGARHGGLFGPYCPNCYAKSNDPNGGIPPLWQPPSTPPIPSEPEGGTCQPDE